MTPPSISLNVVYAGGTQFIAESSTGSRICMGKSAQTEGGCACNTQRTNSPLDVFISSLGGCVGIVVVTRLSENGVTPDSFNVRIDATRHELPPHPLEKIHLTFTLAGAVNEDLVEETIRDAIKTICPIAMTFSQVADISWEYQVV